jgi:hypothetical protein
MTFVLALSLIGRWLDRRELSFQAHALAIVAWFRLLAVNCGTEMKWGVISARLVTLGGAAAIYYVTAPFCCCASGRSGWWTSGALARPTST